MYVAIKTARVNDKFQDSLYLFLELVRAGVVHGHLWSGRAFSGGPSFGTGAYPCFFLFVRTTGAAVAPTDRRGDHRLRRLRAAQDPVADDVFSFLFLVWCGVCSRLADDEKSCMLLVMRVLSILPLNCKVRSRRSAFSRR